ncbi:MAG TPA: hypothetical protein VFW21_03485 [Mycobacterium sp.]|nr:hypothetical protein [Mycobacterium sp.]
MDPVEINAGAWYLRALRADTLMDDRPALAEMGVKDPQYVAHCAQNWKQDTRYTWAVCEPTTGEMLAQVDLDPATGDIGVAARAGHEQAAQTAADAVRRFADANELGF